MLSFRTVLFVWLIASLASGCQETVTQTDKAKIGIELIQAINYAELIRMVLKKDCSGNSALALSLPACKKIDSVPNEAIEKMALPYFLSHISTDDAATALEFWGTPEGEKISRALIQGIEVNDFSLLSESEIKSLDTFNKSKAGRSLSKLADNRKVSLEIIRSIGFYEK